MRITVKAIYEDGIPRPLRAVNRPECCSVQLVAETKEDAQLAQQHTERAEWLAQSERSLSVIWDNPEDDAYNALLTPKG